MKKKEGFQIGDRLVGTLNTYHQDYRFYRVVGFTKSGNPRVEQVKCVRQSLYSTPSQSEDKLIPDFDAPYAGPVIARYSKVNQAWQVKADQDFHYLLRKYDPEKDKNMTEASYY